MRRSTIDLAPYFEENEHGRNVSPRLLLRAKEQWRSHLGGPRGLRSSSPLHLASAR